MNWKKILCGALTASMIFTASVFCSAAEESANAKLARIETDTYGREQSGALLDRISRLEKSYSGRNMSGNMNARIEAIYDTLYDNNAEPGILAKINVLEWNLNNEVATGGVDLRLVALENQILGKTLEGTFNERIRALAKASYGAEILPMSQVQIPANTLIKVVTTSPVNAKILQEGDTIPVRVAEDIFIGDNLVFARGLPGEGVIVNIRLAKNIFTNGKVETDFYRLKSLDGQDVETFTGEEAFDEMADKSMSRGLSLIGQTFSGKHKQVEEVFIRGKNVDLPAGIELYIQTKKAVVVYGLKKNVSYTDLIVENPEPEIKKEEVKPEVKEEKSDSEFRLAEDERGVIAEERKERKPAPTEDSRTESEGKNLEGYDGEIIEIIDEEWQ